MLPSNPTPSAYWPNALQSSPDNSPLRPQFQHLTQKPLSNNNLNTSIPSDPLNHQNSSLNDSSINPSPTPSPASVNLTLDDPSQTLLNSTWEGVSNSPPQQNQSIIHDPNDDSSSGLKIPPVALGGASK